MNRLLSPFKYATRSEICLNSLGLVACICAGAVQPLMNIPFGEITSDIVGFENGSQDPQRTTNNQIVYFCYFAAGAFVSTYVYMSIWVYTGETVTNRIRAKAMKSLLSQEIAFYQDGDAVTLSADLQAKLDTIQSGLSEKVPLNFMYTSCAVTGFIVALVKSWRLGLTLLSILPVLLTLGFLLTRYGFAYMGKVMTALASSGGIARESFSGITTLRSLGAEHRVLDRVKTSQEAAVPVMYKKALVWGSCMGAMTFVVYAGYALCFGFGGQLLRRGDIQAGELITVFLSIMMGSFALAQVPNNLQAITSAFRSLADLEEIMQRKPSISSPTDPIQLDKLSKSIIFTDVSFAYPSRPDVPVLNGVNFEIKAGEAVAFVGQSGAGKSTIASLLLSLYQPTGGSISFDDTDLLQLDLKNLRSTLISSVLQEPQLFTGTIYENLTLGIDTEVTQTHVDHACRTAQASDFIDRLPQGLQTPVGISGTRLSGGQKARIAIARALLRSSPILLFDEATANLDTISEKGLTQAMMERDQRQTTIIIAHRLATVRRADRIFVVHNGRIVATGTHEELISDIGGPYHRLFTAELSGKERDEQDSIASESQTVTKDEASENGATKEPKLEQSVDLAKDQLSSDPKLLPSLRALASCASGSVSWIVIGTMGSIAAGLLYPGFAIVYALAYSTFASDYADARQQNLNAVYFLLCAVAGGVGTFAQWYGLNLASDRLANSLRLKMLGSVYKRPISFFDDPRNSSGSLSSIFNNAPNRISAFVGTSMGTFIASVSTLAGGIVVALIYSWKLGLVNIAVLPLTLGTGIVRLKVVDGREGKTKLAHEPASRKITEAINQILTVVSLGAEDQLYRQYMEKLDHARKSTVWMAFTSTALFALAQTNMYFVIALGFWYGSKLVYDGEISSRAFFAVFVGLIASFGLIADGGQTAVVSGSFQAVNVLSQAPELSLTISAARDLGRLVSGEATFVPPTKEREKPVQPGDLVLDDVSFSYPTRPEPSLLHVSLQAMQNGFTAICGPSGSGKSTIVRLIERFYEPSSGSITLGGIDVRGLDETAYRAHFSLVTQEPMLFNLSILENVLLGLLPGDDALSEEAKEERVREALKMANLDELVEGLPDGIHTILGSEGIALSGGQRQRLVLARALLRNPSVLLLDEATSSLDLATERRLQDHFDQLAAQRSMTVIAIAHRLPTIRRADVIYVLQYGRLIEKGTWDKLIRDGKTFAAMAMDTTKT